MTTHEGLPVAGYQSQSSEAVAMVNSSKQLEEQVLRFIDSLSGKIDPRWIAIGRTHIEQGFMAINRAVFQPSRVKLPGD
jgi:hypothetical protein